MKIVSARKIYFVYTEVPKTSVNIKSIHINPTMTSQFASMNTFHKQLKKKNWTEIWAIGTPLPFFLIPIVFSTMNLVKEWHKFIL